MLAQTGSRRSWSSSPHYNQRRAPDSKVKLVSTDIPRTLTGIRQGVSGLSDGDRVAGGRPEVDADQLGMAGTTLGSFWTALTSANEPRIKNVCMVLAAAGWWTRTTTTRRASRCARRSDAIGGKNLVKKLIAPVGPDNLRGATEGKNLLMVPRRTTTWCPRRPRPHSGSDRQAADRCGSNPAVTAGLYSMSILREVRDHFHAK